MEFFSKGHEATKMTKFHVPPSALLLLPARYHVGSLGLPATAKRLEGSDSRAGGLGLRLCSRVGSTQQALIGLQNLDQADDALLVGREGGLPSVAQRIYPLCEHTSLLLTFDQSREGVLDVLRGTQHGQPICSQRFRFLALRQIDLRVDAAEVEQAPA